VNVLGLLWDTSGDTLTLAPKELTSTHNSLITKREVLKDMSKIFDPLALYVKNSEGENKVYICLFTCGLTRAVHLEVVTDLNVETFLQAFRRFVSWKSLPQVMLSDNASTYVSAAEELEKLFSSPKFEEALSSRGVKWKFILKRAPWYGGFWERLIDLTKTTIKKVLGRSFIMLAALQTLVVEIEAVLNDRPLTYLSSDVTDPELLTPSHLLYG